MKPSSSSQLSGRVLVVEDDSLVREMVVRELRDAQFWVEGAGDGRSALDALAGSRFDAVVLDLGLPDMRGEDLLAQIRETWRNVQVVVLTASEDLDTAVACTRAGASDYLIKPFDATRLGTSVRNASERGRMEREIEGLRTELKRAHGFGAFIGRAKAMRAPLELLARAAQSPVSVLIEGESGTGKEVAARALHEECDRSDGPFIAINCGALPENLVESELFGHRKGAFTGAVADRAGCFEQANGGTIFLDEVGELPPDVQVRLLRVLQERRVQRVGDSESIPVDVRVVAATNRELRQEVEEGRFREDLYYRLAVFPVRLPPLRDRSEDVLVLAHAFLDGLPGSPGTLSTYATRALLAYPWPGNVRELKNAMERASVLEDASVIRLSSLPPEVVAAAYPDGPPDTDALEALRRAEEAQAAEEQATEASGPEPADGRSGTLIPHRPSTPEEVTFQRGEVLRWEEYERRIIQHALDANQWSIKDTLAALGIGRATLYRKIERFGLERPGRGE